MEGSVLIMQLDWVECAILIWCRKDYLLKSREGDWLEITEIMSSWRGQYFNIGWKLLMLSNEVRSDLGNLFNEVIVKTNS